MTKSELQQELKEKVKEGVKPSDIKRLKRSKSADDISQVPPPPLPNDPPHHLLQDQLAQKQKLIESLKAQLEEKSAELTETKQALDQSLAARIAGVKTFGQEHEKRTKAEQELNQTIDEASEEINSADKKVSSLRKQLKEAQEQISKLQKELKLSRSSPKPTEQSFSPLEENFPTLKHTLYALFALWLVIVLTNSKKYD